MPRKRQRAGFQGELGAFSHVAVQQLLGPGTQAVPFQRFEQVFQALTSGSIDAAVIPIENTLHGSVHENYDHLPQFELDIVAETHVRIAHTLIAPPGVPFARVKRVYSHPVALNQCLRFFAANPGIERVAFYDTAGSVKTIMEERLPETAAIASAVAAEMYGARILKRNLEDDPSNFTRFFLLRRPGHGTRQPHARVWKTSLVFSTRNVPGSLFRSLAAFSLRNIDLAKIESRPIRGKPWEYLFYVDFVGRVDDPTVQKALGHLGEVADFLRVLGCYPKSA